MRISLRRGASPTIDVLSVPISSPLRRATLPSEFSRLSTDFLCRQLPLQAYVTRDISYLRDIRQNPQLTVPDSARLYGLPCAPVRPCV